MICRVSRSFFVVLVIICISSFSAKGQDVNVIFKHDFENNTLGIYDPAEWKKDWDDPGWASRLSKTFIEEKDGSKVMKWIYPEGTWGINEELGGGGQWESPIQGFHEEIYMSYNMMVKPGIDFVRSGKLPGIKGGSGDEKASGTPPDWDDGFSCGLAFQGTNDPRGNLAFYLYHQDQVGDYGDLLKWPDPYNDNEPLFVFKKDNVNELWVNITLRIVMNTVKPDGSGGNYDGILEGYINGRLMYSNSGLRFRNHSTIGIDKTKIYSFYGGSGDIFATSKDEWMIFDDFYIFTYAEDSGEPMGNTPSPEGRVLDIPWLKNVNADPPEKDTEAPSVPDNLRATDTTRNSISITWDASTDNVRVTGYRIFVNNTLETAISNREYRISGLTPGEEYEISISAIDAAANESARTTPIVVSTLNPDLEPPTAPSSVSMIRVTGNSLEFKWQASQDNTGVEYYEIWLNGDSVGINEDTQYKASNLNPNTLYEITIRAFDAYGNSSPFSEPLSRRTESSDTQAPSTPTGLQAETVTKESIHLIWNPSTDNVGVLNYKVLVNNDVMAEPVDNEEIIEDLSAGLTYVISVSALDESGNESPESDTIHVSTLNDDFTLDPKLPEVYIVNLDKRSSNPGSITEMKSLGFAELDAYGIIVTQGDQAVEEGDPIFADKSLTEVKNEERITDGLQLLYNFSDNEGNIVSEISESGKALDLHINRPLNTTWLPGQGLKLMDNTTLAYDGTPTRLIESLSSTNEITVEAWVSQCETEQNGPARILTLSNGNASRVVTLGHEGDETAYDYVALLNTSNTDANGLPELVTTSDFTSKSLHHIVYTRDRMGFEKMYVNGIELSSGIRGGDFSSWEGDYTLTLGNEFSGERPWKGIFYLVAIYNKALSSTDVNQNFVSGFGKIRYTTELSELKPNIAYKLAPFVRTDQGIVYGEKKNFLIENVLYTQEEDSLYIAVYPNPTNGEFKLHVEYPNTPVLPAMIRVADMSGQLLYLRKLEFIHEDVNTEVSFNLSSQISRGIYSIVLTVGNRSVARRLIVQ